MLDGPWAAEAWTGIGVPGMFDWNCILFDRYVQVRTRTTQWYFQWNSAPLVRAEYIQAPDGKQD